MFSTWSCQLGQGPTLANMCWTGAWTVIIGVVQPLSWQNSNGKKSKVKFTGQRKASERIGCSYPELILQVNGQTRQQTRSNNQQWQHITAVAVRTCTDCSCSHCPKQRQWPMLRAWFEYLATVQCTQHCPWHTAEIFAKGKCKGLQDIEPMRNLLLLLIALTTIRTATVLQH